MGSHYQWATGRGILLLRGSSQKKALANIQRVVFNQSASVANSARTKHFHSFGLKEHFGLLSWTAPLKIICQELALTPTETFRSRTLLSSTLNSNSTRKSFCASVKFHLTTSSEVMTGKIADWELFLRFHRQSFGNKRTARLVNAIWVCFWLSEDLLTDANILWFEVGERQAPRIYEEEKARFRLWNVKLSPDKVALNGIKFNCDRIDGKAFQLFDSKFSWFPSRFTKS